MSVLNIFALILQQGRTSIDELSLFSRATDVAKRDNPSQLLPPSCEELFWSNKRIIELNRGRLACRRLYYIQFEQVYNAASSSPVPRGSVAVLAAGTIKSRRGLFLAIAFSLFDLKVGPITIYEICVIRKGVTAENVEQLTCIILSLEHPEKSL